MSDWTLSGGVAGIGVDPGEMATCMLPSARTLETSPLT